MKSIGILIVLISICISFEAFAGGSSGVGNLVIIAPGISTRVVDLNRFKFESDKIKDVVKNEDILSLEQIEKSKLEKYGQQLVKSQLGSADGYEFLPERSLGQEGMLNFWIVCGEGKACLKLTPLSRTNPRIMDIIGTLGRAR